MARSLQWASTGDGDRRRWNRNSPAALEKPPTSLPSLGHHDWIQKVWVQDSERPHPKPYSTLRTQIQSFKIHLSFFWSSFVAAAMSWRSRNECFSLSQPMWRNRGKYSSFDNEIRYYSRGSFLRIRELLLDGSRSSICITVGDRRSGWDLFSKHLLGVYNRSQIQIPSNKHPFT